MSVYQHVLPGMQADATASSARRCTGTAVSHVNSAGSDWWCSRSNSYWRYHHRVPRPRATDASERRVARLVDLLFRGLGDGSETIADVARSAGLEHETVRRLWRNPGGRRRSGPGFFVVAALARARGVSLDRLASESLSDDPLVGSE